MAYLFLLQKEALGNKSVNILLPGNGIKTFVITSKTTCCNAGHS